jgi:modification methylase
VLDPFVGSGTTAYVAGKMGRQWIGIEKDAGYVSMAKERLAKLLGRNAELLPL